MDFSWAKPFALAAALCGGVWSAAQSQDLSAALDGLRAFKPNESQGWAPQDHARYYDALAALDEALLAEPDSPAVAHWFGADSQGKETPVSQFLVPRFTNNFAAGPLLTFETAALFETFFGMPWAFSAQDLAGCVATGAFAALAGDSGSGAVEQRLGAINAGAAAMQFSIGATGAERRLILQGQEPTFWMDEPPEWYLPLQKQRLMSDYIFFLLFDLPSEPFGQRAEADLLFDNVKGTALAPALLEAVKADMPEAVSTAITQAGDYFTVLEPIFELRDEAARKALCAL